MEKPFFFEDDIDDLSPHADRMIGERIAVHDKYQFETKLVYHLDLARKSTTYDIETYFFFPPNLHINPRTYSKDQFYSDIQSYIRFKTPSVPLSGLAEGEGNPLGRLVQSAENLRNAQDTRSLADFEYWLRLFCCIVKSCLRDHVAYLAQNAVQNEAEQYVDVYLREVQHVLERFRALGETLDQPHIGGNPHRTFGFGDEYLSMVVEDSAYEILRITHHLDSARKAETQDRLAGLASAEIEHRRGRGYRSVPDETSDNEEFIFRKSTLKKYIGSVLFLNTRIKREGRLLEQVIFGIAAGLAMVFATAIAFVSQYKYGVLSLPFFTALVVSYMFKDRIKELARAYLSTVARAMLFDHKTSIYAKKHLKIGYCREGFDFVPEDKVPRVIRDLRKRDRFSDLEHDWLGENVIRYRKQIRIFSRMIRQTYHGALSEGLNDIMRLSVQRFLAKMDNPKRTLHIPHGNTCRSVVGRRVYHVSMIVHYRINNEAILERYRLVLNRNGIKRIEIVDTIRRAARAA